MSSSTQQSRSLLQYLDRLLRRGLFCIRSHGKERVMRIIEHSREFEGIPREEMCFGVINPEVVMISPAVCI